VIDHDRGLARASEHAVLAEHDFAQIVVVADADHDEVLPFGRLSRRTRTLAAVLRDPFCGFGRGAVIDRDVMAALRLEMPRHRVTHDSEPDECDLCHYLLRATAWRRNGISGRTVLRNRTIRHCSWPGRWRHVNGVGRLAQPAYVEARLFGDLA
jgi:hypothetical protein